MARRTMRRDRSTLALPAPEPLTPAHEAELSDMLGKIHRTCREHDHDPIGAPYMTWVADLRDRSFSLQTAPGAPPVKVLRFGFTGHKDASNRRVGSRFQFETEGRSETFFVRGEIAFTGLQLYLSGNEFERRFPPAEGTLAPHEWDSWGQGLSEAITRRYERVIHPHVLTTLATIHERRPERPLVVWDLGGGAGELAERICDDVTSVAEVVMIEQSEALLAKARDRARKHPGRLSVQAGDLTTGRLPDIRDGRPDVIVSSGLVAQQVLGRSDGLRVMQACHDRLASGGLAVIPSYSPALLDSRDYETLGFRVHNKTLSVIEQTARGRALRTNDFYVVEKV